MAVAFGSVEVSTHNTSINADIDASIYYDAEVNIYGGLDAETEQLIENVRRAVERLRREYGIEVLVSPSIVYWDVTSINIAPYQFPILVINGAKVLEGVVPSVDEIIDIILTHLGLKGRDDRSFFVNKRDELVEVAASTW